MRISGWSSDVCSSDLSLQTNVQSVASDGAFTQTALRVEVLGGELATVDLANATVGPNEGSGPTGPGVTRGGTTPAGVRGGDRKEVGEGKRVCGGDNIRGARSMNNKDIETTIGR